ncbi:MAG: serine/threonine protein kinase [Planctomycetes bacterium]|jgi:serine/threonine protein kinase|nr:serine/threonine protein kinase [Planctomycetota bacterium]HNZ66970.1 serine/threonine-protein kinase [Planctomycetota bacterium]HPY73992.1 serine/threonine-protein kinase [Planctomycetota bacterium]HQB01110.1 serine/threonine-protein kinase [Planctomycetota bacterium]
MPYFILGCPCGTRIEINTEDMRSEIRCNNCRRYIKIPRLNTSIQFTTKTLLANKKDNLIGKILAKRYKIESYIADGAMGRVYRGIDLSFQLPVAVKILKNTDSITEHQEKRFIHEARIASLLQHSGIVMVRNLHRSKKGGYFMVMDLCPGRSLKSILEEKRKLPIPDALEIAYQVLTALKIAHAKGIIHRDIKPANVMIEETKEGMKVRILDFGIAKVFSNFAGLEFQSLTKTGYIVGTTHYMASEQILGTELGVHTDIYGVGALLYHLLTGNLLFQGSQEKVLRSIVRDNPEPMKNCPLLLNCLVLKALQKQGKHRYKSADEFMQAINRYRRFSYVTIYDTNLIIETLWHRLGGETRHIIAMTVILLILFLTIIFTQFFYLHKSYERIQIEQELQHKNYMGAYQILLKSPSNVLPQDQREFIIQEALKQTYKKNQLTIEQKLDFLKEIIHHYSSEISDSKWQHILNSALEEEYIFHKVENLLQQKKIPEATHVLQTPVPKELQIFTPRDNQKKWIQKIK